MVVQENKVAFFADSESSAVRCIDLKNGRVSAVCGANKNPSVSLNMKLILINNSLCIYTW